MNDYKQAAKDSIKSLYVFMLNFWEVINKDELIDNWHIKYLCDFLTEQFYSYQNGGEYHRDVIVNIPPGTSKSTIFSQMFPVWVWLHAPHFTIITTSYGGPVIDHSTKSKQIVQSEKFNYFFQGYYKRVFGHQLRMVKNTEVDWRNNFGGQRISATTGGSITGRHAHIIIRDDPMSQQQSTSPAYRKTCHNFNDRTLPTRKKDKLAVPTYTIMQRLHDDDTTGHELAKQEKKIHHIQLPAEMGGKVEVLPKALCKKYIDGLLDPFRLSREALKSQLIDLGSQDYSGQFLQSPTVVGGNKIKEEWFEYIQPSQLPGRITWDLWVDGAYTKNTANDPTGLMIAGYNERTKTMYIKHCHDAFMEMPELLKLIPEYADLHDLGNRSRVRFEPKASGTSLKQMVNNQTVLSAVPIVSKLIQEGKEARIQTAAPKVEAGKVVLVKGAWNDAFVSQICGFPNAKHDEYVDLIGYACDHYFKKKTTGVRRAN